MDEGFAQTDWLEEIESEFRPLIEKGRLAVTWCSDKPKAFDNAVVILSGPVLDLALVRDRGQADPRGRPRQWRPEGELISQISEWYRQRWSPVEWILNAVGADPEVEFCVKPLAETARLIESHWAKLEAGLADSELMRTELRIETEQERNRRRLDERWARIKRDRLDRKWHRYSSRSALAAKRDPATNDLAEPQCLYFASTCVRVLGGYLEAEGFVVTTEDGVAGMRFRRSNVFLEFNYERVSTSHCEATVILGLGRGLYDQKSRPSGIPAWFVMRPDSAEPPRPAWPFENEQDLVSVLARMKNELLAGDFRLLWLDYRRLGRLIESFHLTAPD